MMNKNRSSPNQVFAVVLIAALFLVYMFAPPFMYVGSPGPAMAGFGSARGFPSIVSKSITFNNNITINALLDLNDGQNNTGIGTTACDSIVSGGTQNVCVGTNAGTAISTGDGTVAIGFEAGNAINNASGGVYIGFRAGLLSTGGKNVLMGFNAGGQLTTEANQLVIDNSNTLTPLIYGDFANNNVGFSAASFGTNAVGVLALANGTAPTTSPADIFQMWSADRGGAAGKAGLHIRSEDGTSHVFSDLVGIGTVTPDVNLEIFGASSTLRLRDSGATADATLAFMEFGGTDTGSWGRTGYVGDISSANTHIHLQAELGGLPLGDPSGGSVVVLSGGSVGINAATPITTLTLGSGTFSIKELASADAPTAAHGQLWVKTATPNELWFTDDDGNDVQLGLPGGGALQTLPFGGTWDGVGNFLQANAKADTPDKVASASETKQGAVAGTIQKMVFYHEGDLSSNNATIKIHANGTPVATKTATGAANVADVFNAIGVAVNDGDIIEVEFDAGSTNPGKSVVTIMIE